MKGGNASLGKHPGHMSQTHNSQQLAGATVISDPGSLHTKIPSLEPIPKLWTLEICKSFNAIRARKTAANLWLKDS